MFKIKKKIIYFIESILLSLLFIFLKILPLNLSSFLMGKLASIVGPKLGISKKAYNNIKYVMPEKNEEQSLQIIKGMWENLGKVFGEYPHLSKLDPEKNNKIEVCGKKNLELIKKSKIPAIFFSGHIANWEISPIAAIRNDVPVLSIFREPNNPFVNFLIKYLRSNLPMAPKGKEGAKQLIRSLKKGTSIGLVIDQKMNDGISVPFFGISAMTPSAIADLALRFDCPIVPVHIERLAGVKFRVIFEPPLKVKKSGDQKENIYALMVQINDKIEEWIRARPEQWLWLHNRWSI
mgnify:CR=1 FL=1